MSEIRFLWLPTVFARRNLRNRSKSFMEESSENNNEYGFDLQLTPIEYDDITPFEQLLPNFVSKHVLEFCQKKAEMVPKAVEGFAVIVMCDVSGYSALASTLGERGPEGVEILARVMKEYLDKIIHTICIHGGDIVKFVGDAVIFYWKAPTNKENESKKDKLKRYGELVLKACLCCLELLDLLNPYNVEIPAEGGGFEQRALRIHLGIGAGQIFDVHVGGAPGRWEHVCIGDAIEQISQVLDLAKAGQLALSQKAFRYFGEVVEINGLKMESFDKTCVILNGLSRMTIVPKTKKIMEDENEFYNMWEINQTTYTKDFNERIKLYVNQSALYKLESDLQHSSPIQLHQGVQHLMSINELRQATTIFIKISSIPLETLEDIEKQVLKLSEDEKNARTNMLTFKQRFDESKNSDEQARILLKIKDCENVIESAQNDAVLLEADKQSIIQSIVSLLQKALTVVQTAISKHEGILRQFHVDDKGAIILVFFGLPPLAHKNDASQAIRAALEINTAFGEIFEHYSMGITTGVISIGGVGNSLRTEYALMGDSINMAARLMFLKSAHRSMLCDDRTKELCEHVEFEGMEPQKVKGKSYPINVYRPIRIKEIVVENKTNLSFIGRKKEIEIVHDAIRKHSVLGHSHIALTVEGDTGTGVTTMANIIEEEVIAHEYLVLKSTALETQRNKPYFVFADLTRDLIKIFDTAQWGVDGALKVGHVNQPIIEEEILKTSEDSLATSTSTVSVVNSNSSDTHNSQSLNMLNRTTIFSKPNLTSSMNNSSHDLRSPKSPLGQLQQETREAPIRQSMGGTRQSKMTRNSLYENSTMWLVEFEQLAKSFNSTKRKVIDPYMSSIMGTIFPGEFPVDDGHRQKVTRDLPLFLSVLLNTLTNVNRIILQVHECQWMDPNSWNICLHLMKQCPRLFIVLLSRPEKMYMMERVKFWQTAKQSGFQINLKGFDKEDMKDFIVHAWQSITTDIINNVDNELLERVRETSGGNPLFAKSILITIRTKNAYFIENKKLHLTGAVDVKGIMPGSDMHSLIVSQFDRVEPVFQVFLKIASLLGHQFFLVDVLLFITDGKIIGQQDDTSPFKKTQKEIVQMIAQWDKYNFIMLANSGHNGEILNQLQESEFLFCFKNSVIRESIYSTMLVSHRQQMHLSIAKYLEEKMDAKNIDRLLLMIYEHYAHTDDTHMDKKRMYLERVSDYFFDHKLWNEAVHYYQLLLDLIIQLEGRNIIVTNEKKCKWFANTAEAYLSLDKVLISETFIKRALHLLDVEIPNSSAVMALKLKFLRSKCLKQITTKEKDTANNTDTTQLLVRRVLHLYALITEEMRQFEISEYCHLKAYIISSEYCSDDTEHPLYLSNMAFNVFINTSSIKAIDASRVAVESIHKGDLQQACMSIWKNHCHLCAYAGEIDNADLYATRYIKACVNAGTLKWISDAYMFGMLMKYLKHEHQGFLVLANSLQNYIRPDSDPETIFWAQFACLFLSINSRNNNSKEQATIIAENLARKSLDEAYQRIPEKFAEIAIPFHMIMCNPEDVKTVKRRMEFSISYLEEVPMTKWGYWLGILFMLEYINENPENDLIYERYIKHVMSTCMKVNENTLGKLVMIFCKGLIYICQGQWKSGANEWVKAFVSNKNFEQYAHLLEIMKAGIIKYGHGNLINAVVKIHTKSSSGGGQRKASIVNNMS